MYFKTEGIDIKEKLAPLIPMIKYAKVVTKVYFTILMSGRTVYLILDLSNLVHFELNNQSQFKLMMINLKMEMVN